MIADRINGRKRVQEYIGLIIITNVLESRDGQKGNTTHGREVEKSDKYSRILDRAPPRAFRRHRFPPRDCNGRTIQAILESRRY